MEGTKTMIGQKGAFLVDEVRNETHLQFLEKP